MMYMYITVCQQVTGIIAKLKLDFMTEAII